VGLTILGVTAIIAYRIGHQVSKEHIEGANQSVKKMAEQVTALEKKVTQLSAENKTLTAQYEQLQAKYDSDVPDGELAQLTNLAKQQLDNGLNADRLAMILRAAQPPRNCTDDVKRRFVVKTPLYDGPDSKVTLAGGRVTISAHGQPVKTADGKMEAWYDPNKPVTVKFTVIGGKSVVKTGQLPIHHTIVDGDREHRFTIAKGQRSFATVIGDSCDYSINRSN
jgi:outer membrane murein-binding lipoprotein Lpp